MTDLSAELPRRCPECNADAVEWKATPRLEALKPGRPVYPAYVGTCQKCGYTVLRGAYLRHRDDDD